MPDNEKKIKSVEDIPTYGDTYKKISKCEPGTAEGFAGHILNSVSGSAKASMESDLAAMCLFVDMVKYAHSIAESQGTDLFTLMMQSSQKAGKDK